MTTAAGALLLTAVLAGGAASAAGAAPSGAPASAAVSPLAADVSATATEQSDFRIVGIGDSLAAGYEHGMTASSVPYGFVDRLYEQALFRGRAEVSNYGILGLTSEGFLKLMQSVQAGTPIAPADVVNKDPRIADILGRAPQMRADLQQADLIAVAIGGNDFWGAFGKLKDGASFEEIDAWIADSLDSYAASLEASLRIALALQPKAEIVVADLYSPVPNTIFYANYYDYLWQAADRIKARAGDIAAKLKAEGYDVRLADVAADFRGKETSMTSFALGMDIHPNVDGYAAMGETFARTVWGDYRTVAPRAAGVPVSVVVSGKEVASPFKPVSKAGRTYLVLKDISDAIGADLSWDNKTKTATLERGGHRVALTVGARTMAVDGAKISIDAPAFLLPAGKEVKTYVPLSALAQGLGLQVVYRSPLKTVFLNP